MIGNFTRSDRLTQLSHQHSQALVPFGLRTTKKTVKILYMSLTQTQELTGTTTPKQKSTLKSPSVMNNCVHIGTMTKYAFGSQGKLGEKTIRASTSHE